MFGYKLVKTNEYNEIIESYRSKWLKERDRADREGKDSAIQTDLNRELQRRFDNFKAEVDRKRFEGLLDVDIGDPTPDKPEQRREYILRVSQFYSDILKQKCFQMVSIFHRLLEEETNDHETNQYLKMGIYICREWMKWGDQAVNEQIGYITEINK